MKINLLAKDFHGYIKHANIFRQCRERKRDDYNIDCLTMQAVSVPVIYSMFVKLFFSINFLFVLYLVIYDIMESLIQ